VLGDDAPEVEGFELDELELDDLGSGDELEFEPESLLAELESLFVKLKSFAASLPLPLSLDAEDDEPLAEDFEARESVTYQPLPLKTMPTG
jgi:hypothetical protein